MARPPSIITSILQPALSFNRRLAFLSDGSDFLYGQLMAFCPLQKPVVEVLQDSFK